MVVINLMLFIVPMRANKTGLNGIVQIIMRYSKGGIVSAFFVVLVPTRPPVRQTLHEVV